MSYLATQAQVIAEGKITANQDGLYDYILDAIEWTSARVEQTYLKAWCEPRRDTRYFDAKRSPVSPDGMTLSLSQPLVALEAATLGDATDVTALCRLLPRGNGSANRLTLTNYTYNWYALTTGSTPYGAISIEGTWCYHPDYAHAWVSTTTLSAGVNSTATTITVTSAAAFSPGLLIRVGLTSEYMRVLAVSGTTITVERGVNGTTADTHLNGAAVARFVPDAEVNRAVLRWSAYLVSRRAAFEQVSFDGVGSVVTFPPDAPTEVANILRLIRPYGVILGV